MTVYANKAFSRFAAKAKLDDATLLAAAADVVGGDFDADLGGGVFKQRIARDGSGKSGGYRAVLLFKTGKHCFFVHGFAKNEKANVSAKELAALKKLADTMLGMSAVDIELALKSGAIRKVIEDNGEQEKN
jgi:hypothetical protein